VDYYPDEEEASDTLCDGVPEWGYRTTRQLTPLSLFSIQHFSKLRLMIY
jgi:hypothetical protein